MAQLILYSLEKLMMKIDEIHLNSYNFNLYGFIKHCISWRLQHRFRANNNPPVLHLDDLWALTSGCHCDLFVEDLISGNCHRDVENGLTWPIIYIYIVYMYICIYDLPWFTYWTWWFSLCDRISTSMNTLEYLRWTAARDGLVLSTDL